MGRLDEQSLHEVDVLSGAFMMIRKTVLEKTGGFDEQFFMYAEDIDLSWRIRQAGFKNYYVPWTSIIHFKGESTRRDFRYVTMFYHAMELFMKKHFKGTNSFLRQLTLSIGVRLHRVITYIRLPFKISYRKKGDSFRVFIKGGPAAQAELTEKLAKKKIQVVTTEAGADEIIYCEGPGQSWKDIILDVSAKNQRFCSNSMVQARTPPWEAVPARTRRDYEL